MKLQVTEEHIAEGTPQSPSSCPIALAFIDRLGEEARPSVSTSEIAVWHGGERRYYRMSESVLEFIRKFDTGPRYTIEPCELTLNMRPLDGQDYVA